MLGSSSTMKDIWFNRASMRVNAFLWGAAENMRNHFRLETQNDSLAALNAALEARLRQYELREAGMEEKSHEVFLNDQRFRYIPATVVRMGRGTAHNYVIVNKGQEDGIRPQSGIITSDGVVGIISAVGRRYSYGLTLMNPNVTISTRIGQAGVDAPLRWDGRDSNTAVAGDIPPHYDIAPGDTVRTSGFSSIFPAGIPIGTTQDSRLVNGSSRQVDVRLFQDFRSIHYVTIVENLDSDEILALEKNATSGES